VLPPAEFCLVGSRERERKAKNSEESKLIPEGEHDAGENGRGCERCGRAASRPRAPREPGASERERGRPQEQARERKRRRGAPRFAFAVVVFVFVFCVVMRLLLRLRLRLRIESFGRLAQTL